MEWRRLRQSELDHELLWLAVSVATFGMAAMWLKAHLATPSCVFHAITGLPCPACGGTRCFQALANGNISAALAWNPLVFLVLMGTVLFDLYALSVLTFRLPRARPTGVSPAVANTIRVLIVAMISANWLYLVLVHR